MAANEKLKSISRRIQRDTDLPVLPQILIRVREVTSDPDSSASDLGEVILKDQVLTARILKVVNSAYYSPYARKVKTVTQAIVVLGFENVRNISLAAAVYKVLSKFPTRKLLTDFWLHSMATGVCSQLVAQECGFAITEEAFVAGLLHDVGKLILAQYIEDEYTLVWRDVLKGAPYLVAERNHLGVDHVGVGLELARKWRFDEVLRTVIAAHHDLDAVPTEFGSPLPRIVNFSNEVCTLLYREGPENHGQTLQGVIAQSSARVGVAPDRFQDVLASLPERIEELSQCFGIEIGPLPEPPPQGWRREVWRPHDRIEIGPLPEPPSREPVREAVEPTDVSVRREAADLQSQLLREQQWSGHLMALTTALSAERDSAKLLRMILDTATTGLAAERALLAMVQKEKGRILVSAGAGDPALLAILPFELPFPAGVGLLARTIAEEKPRCVADADNAIYAGILSDDERRILGSRALATVPVRRQGKVVGALLVDNPTSGEPVSDRDHQALQLLANFVAIVLDRA